MARGSGKKGLMMAMIKRDNQYRGINAHLHSHFQHDNTNAWGEFHGLHLGDMARELNEQLPERYIVRYERSIPFTDEDYLRALVIRERDTNQVVTRIELLSATNKLPGEGADQYIAKRSSALWDATVLVEIDYLHESQSPIAGVPRYPVDEGSYPYLITVTDPRPLLQQGHMRLYGFRVDDAIPTVPIPLAEDEVLVYDFGAVYDYTFRSMASFYREVDYAQEPAFLERYAEIDRARISAVQARVMATE
jgi:hypothetical protein